MVFKSNRQCPDTWIADQWTLERIPASQSQIISCHIFNKTSFPTSISVARNSCFQIIDGWDFNTFVGLSLFIHRLFHPQTNKDKCMFSKNVDMTKTHQKQTCD